MVPQVQFIAPELAHFPSLSPGCVRTRSVHHLHFQTFHPGDVANFGRPTGFSSIILPNAFFCKVMATKPPIPPFSLSRSCELSQLCSNFNSIPIRQNLTKFNKEFNKHGMSSSSKNSWHLHLLNKAWSPGHRRTCARVIPNHRYGLSQAFLGDTAGSETL